MNKATEPVLVVLDDAAWPLPAKAINFIIQHELTLSDPPSRPTVYRALKELEKRGWIENRGTEDSSGYWVITDGGRDWLDDSAGGY